MEKVKSWKDFLPFYRNDLIREMAPAKRWTVSDQHKVPMNMRTLADTTLSPYERVCGAKTEDDLADLKTVCELLPTAKTNTYYLDTVRDGICVLDIEKTCPPYIREKLLHMPYAYGERSMSGLGYHLLFKIPADAFQKYPIAAEKVAMKEEHKWYEILMCHYVTFTRNMIPLSDGSESFDDLFYLMCSEQKHTVSADIDVENIDPGDFPGREEMLSVLAENAVYGNTPEDFNNDMSRYEFGCAAYVAKELDYYIRSSHIEDKTGHTITDNERAWLVYENIKDQLPYRAKHDQARNGLPWLLYTASNAISARKGE